ncbi:MAG: hypothetical protein AAF086_06505 [Planctomycetota bacterium]
MSSIGTGIATGVAAVAQTAQQTARAKDNARNTAQRVAQDSGDAFVERLQSPNQADDPGAELPDRQAAGYEQLYFQDGDGESLAPPLDTNDDAPAAPPPAESPYAAAPTPGHPLYQHLDVQA